jgi:hypothetical protein
LLPGLGAGEAGAATGCGGGVLKISGNYGRDELLLVRRFDLLPRLAGFLTDAHLFSTDTAHHCDEFVTVELIDCCRLFAHCQARKTTVGGSKNDSLIGVVLPTDLSYQLNQFYPASASGPHRLRQRKALQL